MCLTILNLGKGLPASYHCVGRSQFGGMTRVLQGLRRRRLIDGDLELTIRGRALYAELLTTYKE